MKSTQALFAKHRYPSKSIQYGVWLYFVFPLSFCDVEMLLHQRGVVVSHDAIRSWCYKFGAQFAQQVRCKRRQATDNSSRSETIPLPNSAPHRDDYFFRI